MDSQTQPAHLDAGFSSYSHIARMAGPLILSSLSLTLMALADGLIMAWHSTEAVAAIGTASLLFMAFNAVFWGICAYTSTFVAHYVGARQFERIGPAVWQGLYLAVASGIVLAPTAIGSEAVFLAFGHEPELARQESQYLAIHLLGAAVINGVHALTGFLSGRGDNVRIMAIQFGGVVVNFIISFFLGLGFHWHGWSVAPMGVVGAGIGTVAAQLFMLVCLAWVFFGSSHRRTFGTWSGRKLDLQLIARFFRFSLPNGVRMLVEIASWALFLMLIGRMGALELAAASIVLRINHLAFLPLVGLSIAASVLVGQAQGARQSPLAERVVWRSLILAEGWMIFSALVFLLLPDALLAPFHSRESGMTSQEFEALREVGVVMLRYVAVYCLVDAMNLIVLGSLQGAGDTRWTLLATIVFYSFFAAGLFLLSWFGAGLMAFWGYATVMVFALAMTWMIRFTRGKWKEIRLIDHDALAAIDQPQTAM